MNHKIKKRSKTAVIGTVGVPASYGGFETLVENLIESNKHQYVVYCSAKSYPTKLRNYKSAQLTYIPLNANGISSIFYDILSIIHSIFIKKVDNILILGVSGCFILPFIRKISSVRVITNIDGLEWRRDKWGEYAKRFLKWSEKIAVHNSDFVISDNQEIANYVSREYNIESQVISYGGDHAIINEDYKRNDSVGNYALALCRIEPENNVHLILKAFKDTNYDLKFIGNWSNSAYGRSLKQEYSKYENMHLLDPIYDVQRLESIRHGCSIYIHGHSAGGTNPSLVEMMFFGKSIICFDCQYNRYTTHDKANYFKSSSDLHEEITKATGWLSFDNNQGEELKKIAQENYTWDKIRAQYEEILK